MKFIWTLVFLLATHDSYSNILRFENETTVSYLFTIEGLSVSLDKQTNQAWVVCAKPWLENQYNPEELFATLESAWQKNRHHESITK